MSANEARLKLVGINDKVWVRAMEHKENVQFLILRKTLLGYNFLQIKIELALKIIDDFPGVGYSNCGGSSQFEGFTKWHVLFAGPQDPRTPDPRTPDPGPQDPGPQDPRSKCK